MLKSLVFIRSPRKQEGASAVEYGLILGLIAVAIIIILGTMGTQLNDLFSFVSGQLPTGG